MKKFQAWIQSICLVAGFILLSLTPPVSIIPDTVLVRWAICFPVADCPTWEVGGLVIVKEQNLITRTWQAIEKKKGEVNLRESGTVYHNSKHLYNPQFCIPKSLVC
jgi:hypothetical protein